MRLFFALQLPESVKEALREPLAAARAVDGVSWTRIEQLHFTLAFLGEQPSAEAAVLAGEAVFANTALSAPDAVRDVRPFKIGIGGAGAFPNAARPRVLWLGVSKGATALSALADRLALRLRERGFALEERKFRPHLTVGRVKGVSQARRALALIPAGELAAFEVASFQLVQSVLGRGGARHTVVREFTLR